jgi:hypothetical protein
MRAARPTRGAGQRHARWVGGAVAGWLALTGGTAPAQGLEKVLIPGPVIEAHAKYEDDCRNCHVPFDRGAQNARCLACHEDTEADVRQKTGFHGRLKPQPCRACHTEHKGRGAKIAPLDELAFDHRQTDFALRGAHADPAVTCRSCHLPGKKFREAPGRCIDCHRKEDKHKGRFGEKCEACHGERDWKTIHFNHDTATRYPLRGRHRGLKCESCHTGHLYRDKLQTSCVACHRKDEPHKGTLGTSCGDCHTERGWRQTRFDHDKTRFPLRGKHGVIDCKSCHKTAVFKDAPTECIACHRKDDKHKGALGEKCESCHTERNWKDSIFDHGKTRFPLLGSHASVKCEDCHRDPDYKRTPMDCYGCHKKDDAHEGQQGMKCESCHDAVTWKKTRFDHGRTRFPLLGKHLVTECIKCHETTRFKDAKTACVACHDRDDVHKRRLGARCDSCHNPRAWKSWDFNHDRQTKFRLDGAHVKLECLSCHRQPGNEIAKLARTCVSCHAADDVHDGTYGRQCEKCHVTSSFKQVRQSVGLVEAAGRAAEPCKLSSSRIGAACGESQGLWAYYWMH